MIADISWQTSAMPTMPSHRHHSRNRCLGEATLPSPERLFMQSCSETIVQIHGPAEHDELIFAWIPGFLTALTIRNTL